MTCPQCNKDAGFRYTPYETRDPETGYVDYGVRVTCLNPDCGAVSTEEEMDAHADKQR